MKRSPTGVVRYNIPESENPRKTPGDSHVILKAHVTTKKLAFNESPLQTTQGIRISEAGLKRLSPLK